MTLIGTILTLIAITIYLWSKLYDKKFFLYIVNDLLVGPRSINLYN